MSLTVGGYLILEETSKLLLALRGTLLLQMPDFELALSERQLARRDL